MRTFHLNFSTFCSLINLFMHILLCCMSLQQSSILAATATSMPGGNETDRLALLAFKAKVTEDPFQVTSSWNATVHFCKWPGVTCGRRHQRVTILNLMSQKLVGTISPHLGNLSFLRVLHLQNNSFTGEIPPELGYLKRLQILRLHNNSISGVIPADLSACSELVIFNLFNNRLVGKIPSQLGEFSKLEIIHIGSNNLTGLIPPAFGNLSSLQELFTGENHLVGRIPDGLSQLADLTVVVVRGNSLTGTIPASLFNHSSLMAIDVGTNQIEGSLPPHLGNTLPSLQFLSIYRNQFTGSIPVSISNATNLAFLIAGRNGLTGKVPTLEKLQKLQRFTIAINSLGSGKADDLTFLSSLTNSTDLDLLQVNQNKFGGVFPDSISNLSTKLLELSLSYNHISGNVPPGICNLANLEALYLAGNQLTGNIPHEIGRLRKLQQLAFAENRLSGIIPHTFGNLTLLSKVTLSENQIYGSIPSSIGKCRYLVYLDLCCNNLTGVIPKEVFDLSSLSVILDLSQNHLTGSVPMNVGNLKNLGYLDFSENKLSGEIPATLGSCVTLEILSLEANLFQGTVPLSLRFLRGIQVLNLSHNNLSGEIPEYLEDFDFVQNLDLSFNDFGGEVPTEGIFKNASATSIIGNRKLCGGVPELRLPKCETKKRSTFILKFVIPVSCGLVVAILLMGFVYWIWFKKSSSETSSFSLEHSPLRVSYRDLLKATDGFSSANLMGVGSFGSVYKGVFSDGMVVAVKVLNLLHRGASTSFLAECMTLRNIRHRNLVKVLTACSGTDYQGNVFKALVYQYMVNGSLDEWLHPHLEEHTVHKMPANLNLLQRVNIAIDVASALDYLHHHCQTPIVHCDLKPSNVLLDNEMNAHVSDFGLAKFLLEGRNRSSVNQSSSVGVRGSVGYAAPEYGMGRDVSTTGDVYSYGILLLEMLTGKRPTNAMFNDNLNLHSFAQIALAEGVEGIADPVLLQQQDEDIEEKTSKTTRDSGRISQTLGSIFRIGIACSAESPRERPNMRGVVSELLVIRGDVLGAGSKRSVRSS
ncbi:probable LRR receptor-like serine/threonine-protein kinase At3g47570 [Actinidia eriantha]|uniref:probable LRR receptor-like serine/threonine-protein kinase At3g47570 n=1 Tax=Actinidia eriantha TaxID=165200 RepID=UPI0025874AB8|nr:probable LRR receptor-like serine/threonine-protein kinase At3g47570 [Actinidia eriantha]